jgi:dihydrofolate reductase
MRWISIAAVAKNGVIGNGLQLPWNIPADLKFFRDSTRGHLVLMGRKTFDSLGKPLPNRTNVVITRDQNRSYDGAETFHSLESAIQFFNPKNPSPDETAFVIGGAEIYRQAIPYIEEAWITEIQQDAEGDVFFPEYSGGLWKAAGFERTQQSEWMHSPDQKWTFCFSKYLRAR